LFIYFIYVLAWQRIYRNDQTYALAMPKLEHKHKINKQGYGLTKRWHGMR